MQFSRVLMLAPALVLAVSSAPPGAASAPERTAPASVRIVGSGYGHGHGLSQWGAQGAALQELTYREILSFYYPGLKRESIGGDVKVLITADTSADVVVLASSGLRAKSLGSGRTYRLSKSGAKQWRITPAQGGKKSTIAFRASAGWTTFRTVPGEAQFSAGGKPITLRTPAGNRAYRGVLRSAAPSSTSGKRDTVNILPLDNYLKGVVPREVFPSWEPAALRAQSVAARTYAAFERRQPLARHYQICDTSSCQVYGGFTDEYPTTNKAINDTRGEVLTKGGEPAFTQFSASNGGWASEGSFDYLPAHEDPYDTAHRNWSATVTGASIERALPAIGAFRSAEIIERDGEGTYGGRVVRIQITGSNTSTVISGDDFRSYFGLMSTLFKIDSTS